MWYPASNIQLNGLSLNNLGDNDLIVWAYPAAVQNIVIRNCEFNAPNGYGVYFHHVNNALVENSHFQNVKYAAVASNGESQNVTVRGNVVDWSDDTAFDFEEVDTNFPNYSTWTYSITNNIVKSSGGSAIFCINSHDGKISDNQVLNATGWGGGGSIIFASDTRVPFGSSVGDSVISNNILDCVYTGISVYGQDNGRAAANVTVSNNVVTNCQWTGIAIGGWSSSIQVTENTIRGTSLAEKNAYDGITNNGASYSVFSGNTIVDPTGVMRNGFRETWYDYNSITENSFKGVTYPINIASGRTNGIVENNTATTT
jgi:parallel beta-helix repeat protein